jgi:hypothetical protein
MVGVDEFGTLNASRAEIPVGTVEAFVANSIDELLATITDSSVADVPAFTAKEVCKSSKGRV